MIDNSKILPPEYIVAVESWADESSMDLWPESALRDLLQEREVLLDVLEMVEPLRYEVVEDVLNVARPNRNA